jgi:hypothetical protein
VLAADLADVVRLAGTLAARVPALRAAARLTLAHLAMARADVEGVSRELDTLAVMDRAAALEHRAFLFTLPFAAVPTRELAATRDALLAWEPAAVGAIPQPPSALTAHEGLHRQLRSYLLGLLAIRTNRRDVAHTHAAECEDLEVSGKRSGIGAQLAAGIRARLAYDDGDPGRALELLAATGAASRCSARLAALSPFHALAAERFLRSEALASVGRPEEASGWLEGLGQRSLYELVFREPARRLLQRLGEGPPGDRGWLAERGSGK